MLHRWLDSLVRGIWSVSIRSLSAPEARRVHALRVLTLAVSRLKDAAAPYRASVLTLYALLSLVPAIAVGLGIARGFGIEDLFARQIRAALPGDAATANKLVEYAHNALRLASGGVVAGVGTVTLLVAIVRILSHIEYALNAVWRVERPKPLRRRLADHLALVIVAPVGLALAGAANMALAALPWLSSAGVPSRMAVTVAAWLVSGVALAWVYVFLPNARVGLRSAALSGAVAAALLHLSQWGFVRFQGQIASAGSIYGGFSFLPLLILWLQVSWLAFLFGAAVGYAYQHDLDHEFETVILAMSVAARRRFAMRAAQHLATSLARLEGPVGADDLAEKTGLPRLLTRRVLEDLCRAGVAACLEHEDRRTYALAWPQDALTVGKVWHALDHAGDDGARPGEGAGPDGLADKLSELEDLILQAGSSSLIVSANELPTTGNPGLQVEPDPRTADTDHQRGER